MTAGMFRARSLRRTSDQVVVSVQMPHAGPKNWARAVWSPMSWARNHAVVGAANGLAVTHDREVVGSAYFPVQGRYVVGRVVEGLDEEGEDDAVLLTGHEERGDVHGVDVGQRAGLDRQDGVDAGVRTDDDGGRATL